MIHFVVVASLYGLITTVLFEGFLRLVRQFVASRVVIEERRLVFFSICVFSDKLRLKKKCRMCSANADILTKPLENREFFSGGNSPVQINLVSEKNCYARDAQQAVSRKSRLSQVK